MASRVFLHVGTPKSGTTFLQSVWWANKDALAAQGLLLPGKGVNTHYWASCVVRGGAQLEHLPPAGPGAWRRMLARVGEWEGDALISHELFSAADPAASAQALRDLEGVAQEVHVLLTARDLVRQVPAEWQQRTKHGRSQTLDEFIEKIRTDPSMNFWRVQDVAGVLDRWTQGIPADRVHLIVLPPPGGPSSFLWDEVCRLTGIDGTGMSERADRRNESLGLAEAETMRRLSGLLNEDGLSKSTERMLKSWFAEKILRASDPEKIALPATAYPWIRERSEQLVAELSERGYDVVGDLAHLIPEAPPASRGFEELGEDEVAAVAIRALARFVEHEEAARERERAKRRAQVAAADPPRAAPQVPERRRRLPDAGRLWSRLRRSS